jgi:hypothetical protein
MEIYWRPSNLCEDSALKYKAMSLETVIACPPKSICLNSVTTIVRLPGPATLLLVFDVATRSTPCDQPLLSITERSHHVRVVQRTGGGEPGAILNGQQRERRAGQKPVPAALKMIFSTIARSPHAAASRGSSCRAGLDQIHPLKGEDGGQDRLPIADSRGEMAAAVGLEPTTR